MKTQKEYNQCQQPISCHNCSSNQICQAWVDFVKHHNDTKPYAHFDLRVSLSMPSIRKYVMDRTKIVTHSFYPFIHFEKKNSRYGKKGPKKPRELYYCSHLDRCVYQRYAFLLNYQYNIWACENNIDDVAIDKDIKRYVTSKGGIYMRYSDDFIIVLPYERDAEIADFTSYIFSYVESMKGLIDLQKEKTSCYTYKDEVIYEGDQPSSINYLGFLFDGKNIRIRPRAITKYYYRMRRKANTIGRSNWTSSKGRRISAKELYSIYSRNDEKQTFIDYARKAKGILKLNDQEANALIKHHKRKIAMAIKEGQKK